MPTNCHMQTGSKTHAELKKLTLISNVSLDINPGTEKLNKSPQADRNP